MTYTPKKQTEYPSILTKKKFPHPTHVHALFGFVGVFVEMHGRDGRGQRDNVDAAEAYSDAHLQLQFVQHRTQVLWARTKHNLSLIWIQNDKSGKAEGQAKGAMRYG